MTPLRVKLCTVLVYDIGKLNFLLCNHTDPFLESCGIK